MKNCRSITRNKKNVISLGILFIFFYFSTTVYADYYEQAIVALQEGNFPYSVELLHKAADSNNDSRAFIPLGTIYLQGRFADVNIEKGLFYFQKAINRGDTEAMNKLAIFYNDGVGVQKNKDLAITYWEKAFELGHTGAAYNIANNYNPDLTGSESNRKLFEEWLIRAANGGNIEGQYLLAFSMLSNKWLSGPQSTNDKIKSAYKWARLAKEKGHKQAKDLVLFMRKQYNMPQ